MYDSEKKAIVLRSFSCSVWGEDVEGVDCGDKAAAWINAVLNKKDFR